MVFGLCIHNELITHYSISFVLLAHNPPKNPWKKQNPGKKTAHCFDLHFVGKKLDTVVNFPLQLSNWRWITSLTLILSKYSPYSSFLPDSCLPPTSELYLKLENTQAVGSFKVRGVAVQMEAAMRGCTETPHLVTMSAGKRWLRPNHFFPEFWARFCALYNVYLIPLCGTI